MAGLIGSTLGSGASPYIKVGEAVRSRRLNTPLARGGDASSGTARTKASKIDTSTSEALLQSFNLSNDRTHEEQERWELPIVGIVRGIDRRTGTALVCVWKRGDDLNLKGRPLETFPIHQLVKMSKVDFHKQCKRPYMQHRQHQLCLKGEGHDEEMPISLIAYNNHIITELLTRTTLAAKNTATGAPSLAAGTLDENYATREELRQLTLDGIAGGGTAVTRKQKSQRKFEQSKATLAGAALVGMAKEEQAENTFLKEENIVSQALSVLDPGSTKYATFAGDDLEESTSATTVNVHRQVKGNGSKINRLIVSMTDVTSDDIRTDLSRRRGRLQNQMRVDGLYFAATEGWRTPTPGPGVSSLRSSVLQTPPRTAASSPAPSTLVPTPTTIADESSMDTTQRTFTHTYVVESVHHCGQFTVVSTDTDGPTRRFRAVLEGIVVPHTHAVLECGYDPLEELSNVLLRKRIEATHYGRDTHGSIRLNVMAQDMWVQMYMVSHGFARVDTSIVDQVDDWNSASDDHHFNALDSTSLGMLLQAQEGALQHQYGMWCSDRALTNFLTDDTEDAANTAADPPTQREAAPAEPHAPRGRSSGTPLKQVAVTVPEAAKVSTPLPLDETYMADLSLPPLFDYSESSQTFRSRLSNARRRTLAKKFSSMHHMQPGAAAAARPVGSASTRPGGSADSDHR